MIAKTPLYPVIETDRLLLTSIAEPEFDAVAQYLLPGAPRFIDAAQDRDALWWSLATMIGHWKMRDYGHFAVFEKSRGVNIGLVGPWYPRGWPEPELAWQLIEGFEGRGYATEAARGALHWLFKTRKWVTVTSLIADDNTASIALAKRLGAEPEGLFEHRMLGEVRIWRHHRATYDAWAIAEEGTV
ncbi:GNAT family N-acetyltransferase [Poseidonocella sedimentorum]|uniref:Protein N-acetyltransferase, RimJ/RimL family n=1 Tax=Poseidonocella sedimentorum TaxID=871652 RepID=A0A1I6DVS8_9RHOB|nr:GNAT family N-acetyltransferase [Poseidonocella sedimentorum]SFR09620.1 Protein N-acetyltransferase, RimJ/RimL family [Poseidonocella sedimentorum]